MTCQDLNPGPMRQVEEKAGSSMNVKETEECKDMFDVITFVAPVSGVF